MKTLILIFLLFPGLVSAGHLHPEKYYQDIWCKEQKGKTEYQLPDKTRCDCLTDSHAIEVDFAVKWYEALGQSLYYSLQTGKRSGIVLIVENQNDLKYWIRLNSTILHFGLQIDTWKIEP
ncbi:hypothetical protein [Desulfobacula sp.]|uniref:hypothetical protein n=1 Tax=Desulfobacula sp. TaxID=2593537 RepID=UPI001ED79B2B|nr:hypothetical protein [Desulfobacula sp.]